MKVNSLSTFISFEGGEGSGKSTQTELLRERLQGAGISCLLVREPGTTPLGIFLRQRLRMEQRKEDAISPVAELFMFGAARAELVAKVLEPALERPGTVVIADRYADSTTAYQGYGRRHDLRDVKLVNRLATGGTMPDLTFLLDCPPQKGLERVASSQARLLLGPGDAGEPGRLDEEGSRRFEEESPEFHERVRAGYLKMAKQEPERWCVIDAMGTVDEISETIWERVTARIRLDASVGPPATGPALPLWAASDEGVD
jgi:dTMP kinase